MARPMSGPKSGTERRMWIFHPQSLYSVLRGTRLITSGGAITAESVLNQNQADLSQDSFGAGGGGVSGAFRCRPIRTLQSAESAQAERIQAIR